MSNNIKALLKKSGLRADYVAESIGVTRGHLYKMMRGAQNLSLENIKKLADVLGCSPLDIVDIHDLNEFKRPTLAKVSTTAANFSQPQEEAINKELLKECIHTLEEEAKTQGKTFSTDELVEMAAELYEIITEDRKEGICTTSKGIVRNIVRRH